jgi:hypothetical protein
MKKSIILISFCFIVFIAISQVPRNKVVLEIGTGTWCQYCPGAANGADDLIENGKQVAVIENHNGDSYANAFSNARNSYYNITGYPTSKFDGVLSYVGGGSASQSNYNNYLPLYNQRIAINSSFTIQVNGSNIGNNYTLIATITKVATYTGPNPLLHLVLTQSNIVQNWQGMTQLNFVERLMVPDQNGTTMNFSSGDVQVVNLSFSKDASWPLADCEIVAFLQNNTSKEILQGFKVPLNGLLPLSTDAELVSVYNVPAMSCSGKTAPYLKIKNNTTTNLMAASIKYKVNDGSLQTINWTGNLGLNQEALFQLPQFTFYPLAENLFTAYIQTTNGALDPNHINDTVHKPFVVSDSFFSTLNLEIMTDNNPQQTTWQVLNANNQVIFSGGPFAGQPNTLIQQELEFLTSGCYKFVISDSGNDGICCASGNGSFTLRDINNQLIYSNGDFGPKETVEFGMKISILDLTVFLEGPFNTSSFEMNTTLNQGAIIPLNQPYNIEPWNYNGMESVTNLTPDIVDWVLVELRETSGGPETATSSTIIGRQAAFVTNFGKIVGLDCSSFLRFDVEITQNLFIVIHHRNHLSIMNADPLANFGGIFYFDFTGSVDYLYGGSAGSKDILGSAAMASGDGDCNGEINLNDKILWSNDCGKKGYFSNDFNMNQQIGNQDKNDFLRTNLGMESQVPE